MLANEYTADDVIVLAREAAAVLRFFYDDVTPCLHRLKTGERCGLCGRARALLIECDAIAAPEQFDGNEAGRLCPHCEVLVAPGDTCRHAERCMLGDLRDCLAAALNDGDDRG